jgi:biotin transport system substrate-specific component
MNVSTTSLTLVDVLSARRAEARPSRALQAASVLFMTALTAAAAQISIPLPFTQVPFTFQPMVVLLAGLTLGSRLGMASQVLYLALGIAGLPVFAASATLPPGALRLLGPTGGYLMSYPFAALVTGYLAERGFDRRYLTAFAAMLAGLVLIYTCGAAWLGLTLGFSSAVALGIAPFALADVAKLLAAAGILPGLWKIVGADRADHRRQ